MRHVTGIDAAPDAGAGFVPLHNVRLVAGVAVGELASAPRRVFGNGSGVRRRGTRPVIQSTRRHSILR